MTLKSKQEERPIGKVYLNSTTNCDASESCSKWNVLTAARLRSQLSGGDIIRLSESFKVQEGHSSLLEGSILKQALLRIPIPTQHPEALIPTRRA